MKKIILSLFIFTAACGKGMQKSDWASGNPDAPPNKQTNPSNPDPGPTPTTPAAPGTPVAPAKPPAPGLYFSVNNQVVKLANGPGQVWNGCDKNAIINGGYDSDTKCGNGYLHPAMVKHLNEYFFSCVDKASVAANYDRIERVFIRHWGTYVDRNARNSTRLSMHAYARAIDTAALLLTSPSGKVTRVSNDVKDYKGANAVFYDTFRQCWKDSIPSSCQPGDTEYQGSTGHPKSKLGGNSLHNGHIHLAFPPCAGA